MRVIQKIAHSWGLNPTKIEYKEDKIRQHNEKCIPKEDQEEVSHSRGLQDTHILNFKEAHI